MRSVRVVLPASMCALIPILRVRSRGYARSEELGLVVIALAFSKTVKCIGSPPEMSKRPICLGHFVRIIPLFNRVPLSKGRIFDFGCEIIHHRSPAIFRESHYPTHRQRDLAFLGDFNRNLIRRAANSTRLDFKSRLG